MSNQNTVSGTLYKKSQELQVTDKFRKLEFIVKTDGQYPQYIPLQFTNDKCSLITPMNVGDLVTVHFNLEGRLWTGKDGVEKCFSSLTAWKIEVDNKTSETKQENNSNDDIPF